MNEEVSSPSQDELQKDSKKPDLDQGPSSFDHQEEVQTDTKVQPPEVSGNQSLDTSISEDSLDSPSSMLDNEARLEQLEKEHETLRSQYMRIAADFDNFRKRQSRDQEDLRLQLQCNTLSNILPIVDNFERARQQLNPEGEEAQALHKSYQGLYKQLVEVLKQLGVAPMRVVGQSFDPNLHEAVLKEPSEEALEDIILEELQRGYHINGRVLRHALVKVSIGPGPKNSDSESINSDSQVIDNTKDSESSENSD